MPEKNQTKFEVIFAIVNNGFADHAMSAAREAGAKGGTIIKGRGSSVIGIDKKYGLTITPEKELLMIIASVEEKDKIMEAVYQSTLKDDKNKGIVFSMPVTSTVGLKYDKNTKINNQ